MTDAAAIKQETDDLAEAFLRAIADDINMRHTDVVVAALLTVAVRLCAQGFQLSEIEARLKCAHQISYKATS